MRVETKEKIALAASIALLLSSFGYALLVFELERNVTLTVKVFDTYHRGELTVVMGHGVPKTTFKGIHDFEIGKTYRITYLKGFGQNHHKILQIEEV